MGLPTASSSGSSASMVARVQGMPAARASTARARSGVAATPP